MHGLMYIVDKVNENCKSFRKRKCNELQLADGVQYLLPYLEIIQSTFYER
jgi:hypothetical protein